MSRYEPAQPEMDAAFDDSDDEETGNSESQPLVQRTRTPPQPRQTPGGYDFENLDYDHPPPGSPPQPTSSALPNHWGNNNGHVPDFNTNLPSGPRRNWFQRAAATVLSDNMTRRLGLDYQPISGTVGGGNGNDGVFANVTAKPTAPVRIQEGDETFIVPEDSRPEAPPSYAAAQADAVPQYWETTIHAPFASDSVGDMIVDALPTGSLFSFLWNMLVSISFQFIGFLLTYLLHTSHASRLGSRAGLGVTLIQYGFSLRQRMGESYDEEANPWPEWKDDSDFLNRPGANNGTMPEITEAQANAYVASATTEWLSFFLMTIGWFILLTSVLGFWRVKRWESSILASHQGGSTTTAPMATTEGSTGTILGASRIDMLRAGFGFRRATDEAERDAVRAEEGTLTPTTAETGPDTSQRAVVLRAALEREAQLTNDLRRAGLL